VRNNRRRAELLAAVFHGWEGKELHVIARDGVIQDQKRLQGRLPELERIGHAEHFIFTPLLDIGDLGENRVEALAAELPVKLRNNAGDKREREGRDSPGTFRFGGKSWRGGTLFERLMKYRYR
jgi:hypothetical protein